MHVFNKAQAQIRSRQSSFDATAFDESPSFDLIPPPTACSTSSRTKELPSPPGHASGDSSVRRTSIFARRARSNTATSNSSLFSRAEDSDSYLRRNSRDLSSNGSQTSLPDSAASKPKSLFPRGRRLRRESSRLNSITGVEEIEPVVDNGKRSSYLRRGSRKGSTQLETPEQFALRRRKISGPFDFHHLTHTQPKQFPALERTSQNELVAEFWAHRASQMPHAGLRGIKAEDLQFSNFSSEALSSATPSASGCSSVSQTSPDISPKGSREVLSHGPRSPAGHPPSIHHSRSFGSFSRPLPPVTSASTSLPTHVAPRRTTVQLEDGRRNSGLWNEALTLPPGAHRPSTAESLDTVTAAAPHIAHAITTPDDQALTFPAVSPAWSTDLEQVPEEPEGYFTRRSTQQSVLYSPSPEVSPKQTDGDAVRPLDQVDESAGTPVEQMSFHQELRSFAASRAGKHRPMSMMSDTLGAPFIPRKSSAALPTLERAATFKRRSTHRIMDSSWEDDIDYCYEHALEAECDYDWDRTSSFGGGDRYMAREMSFVPPHTPTIPEECEEDLISPPNNRQSGTDSFLLNPEQRGLTVPAPGSMPDLDYKSANSTSTTSVLTPLDVYATPNNRSTVVHSGDAEGFGFTPSLLCPPDYKNDVENEDLMYEDMLNDYESSDRHYPLLNSRSANTLSIGAESSQSARHSMGASSYDSSLQSAACSLASPVRRSRGSMGSVPELVHSRRARKTMEKMVDQLSKDMQSTLAHLDDEEGNDGSAATAGQTFFADTDDSRPATAEEQRSRPTTSAGQATKTFGPTTPPQHKHNRSDASEKLLNGTPALSSPNRGPRSRAASNARRPNQAYTLSLFPAPPKAAEREP
ncbi:hypothetical protein K490DRAFT_65423 [Saccharata proteae CBS 121410]|uniref:CRIB domain-containing protein n=1 Tax=Saccharata proteae CBS 121410 TaxID=1314787 RepID=A0A9P4HVJ4_9PEZI|nr:hypothetical protein K490DRAFT_65423 [Saccharata proteae CBS 121410]